MVDLLKFVKGDGRVWGMKHSWTGNGHYQTQAGRLPNQWFLVKGYNNVQSDWEEFRWDDLYIRRGFDISSQPIYSLGLSAWCPRQMDVGQWYERNAPVTQYPNGVTTFAGNHKTWLYFKARYDLNIRTASGPQAFNGVELEVYDGDAARASGTPWEVYLYAENVGMVGWREYENGQLKRQSDADFVWEPGAKDAPYIPRKPLPFGLPFDTMPNEPMPGPQPQPNPDPDGEPRKIRADIQAKVRAAPTTASPTLRLLAPGTTVYVLSTVEGQDRDGSDWLKLDDGGFVREDLVDGYTPPISIPSATIPLWEPPFTGYTITTEDGEGGHQGVDAAAPKGTVITSAAVGQVAFLFTCSKCTKEKPSSLQHGFAKGDSRVLNDVAWGFGYGNGAVIRYPWAILPDVARDDLTRRGLTGASIYVIHGHMGDVFVQPGDCVGQGTPIGTVDMYGNADGPHDHIEIRASLKADETSIYGRPTVNPHLVFNL